MGGWGSEVSGWGSEVGGGGSGVGDRKGATTDAKDSVGAELVSKVCEDTVKDFDGAKVETMFEDSSVFAKKVSDLTASVTLTEKPHVSISFVRTATSMRELLECRKGTLVGG